MAIIDTTYLGTPFSTYRKKRTPAGPPGSLTGYAATVGDTEAAPVRQPEKGPSPIAVRPLPGPKLQPGAEPSPASPARKPAVTQGDDVPNLLTSLGNLLKTRLTSTVEQDPRYQSQLTDLLQTQKLRREQRQRDLTGLGIIPGQDGEAFKAFDTLGEQDIREGQNLRANVETLRNQDINSALAFEAEGRSQLNDALSRAVAQGEQTGEYIDPQTGQSYDTLTKIAQDRGWALSKAEMTGEFEEPGAGAAPTTLTGYAGGASGAAPRAPKITLAGIASQRAGEAQYGGKWVEDENGDLVWTPTEAARATQAGESLTRMGLTGQVPLLNADGTPALDAQGKQMYGTTLDAQRLGLQTAETFGKSGPITPGTPTLSATAQDLSREALYGGRSLTDVATGKTRWQDTLEGGRLALDRQNAALDRAVAAGQQTGQFIDPETGKAYTTQAALEQAFRQRIASEELYGGTAPVQFTAGDTQRMTGAKKGDPLYNEAFDLDRDGEITPTDMVGVMGASKDLGGGRFSYTPAGARTLGGQQADTQAAIAGRTLDLEQEQIYGGKFVAQPDGTKKWQGTLAWEQMTGDQKIAYAKLAEDTRSTKANEKLALADRLGWTDAAPGKVAWGDFMQAFKDSQEGKPYDLSMDFNGNGKVDINDMFDGQTIGLLAAPGETFETLDAKRVTSEISATAKALKLDEDKLAEVTASRVQDFWKGQQEYMTRATGYVYDAYGRPTEKVAPDEKAAFGEKEMQAMFAVLAQHPGSGVTRADEGYNPAFDLDDSGHISDEEYWNALNTATALTQEWPGGVKRYTAKKSRQQISTLEREQFKDDQDRFNRAFDKDIEQFMAQLGLDEEKIKKLDAATTAQLIGTLATAVMGVAGSYLGRSRPASKNTDGQGEGGGGTGARAGISFGTGGVNVNLGLGGR